MTLLDNLLFEHSKKNIVKIATEIKSNANKIDELIDLICKDDIIYSARASWVFSQIHKHDGALNENHYKRIIGFLERTKIDGIKRNLLSAFETKIGTHNYLGSLINNCFKIIISTNEGVSVKVYSMQIIANACIEFPELKSELLAAIENEINKNTISFKARALRIQKKLMKIRN
jgi:hypothetical protein